MKRHEKTLAICLETLGCCIVLVGILIEIVTGAHFGHILITGGALIAMIGGLLYSKVFRGAGGPGAE